MTPITSVQINQIQCQNAQTTALESSATGIAPFVNQAQFKDFIWSNFKPLDIVHLEGSNATCTFLGFKDGNESQPIIKAVA